jgi:hypothetical protein
MPAMISRTAAKAARPAPLTFTLGPAEGDVVIFWLLSA